MRSAFAEQIVPPHRFQLEHIAQGHDEWRNHANA
jgi:hypothetical protein